MSEAIGKIVCLLWWGAVSFSVLTLILLLAADFAQKHLHGKVRIDLLLSIANVCSAIAICAAAAFGIFGAIYGLVYILAKGV